MVSSNGNSTAQKFGFQGQELQEELGLNWSSFRWRNADPAIGRFFNIDPLAENFYYNSPYNFSENRVIDAIELEGLEKVSIHLLGQMSTDGNSITGLATLTLDIGNDNSLSGTISTKGGNLSLTYNKESGVKYATSEANGEEFQKGAFSMMFPKGIKIPDFLAKFGVNKAQDNFNDRTVQEIKDSEDDTTMNRSINAIFDAVNKLIDSDVMDAYYTTDGSSADGKNKKGEKNRRKFTNVYKGVFKDFTFSDNGISFKGKLIIEYTQEECTSNCDE